MTYKKVREWSERRAQQREGARDLGLALGAGEEYMAVFDASKYKYGVAFGNKGVDPVTSGTAYDAGDTVQVMTSPFGASGMRGNCG